MKLPLVLVLVYAITISSWAQEAANSPTTEQLIQQLQTAVSAAAKSAKAEKNGNDDEPERFYRVATYSGQLGTTIRQSIARGDLSAALQAISQIQTILPDENVQKLADALSKKIQDDQANSERKVVESVDNKVDEAMKACFAAKEAKELDEYILDLSQMSQRQGNNYGGSELARRSAEKARAAVTFLCRWQDYLMQTKSGNFQAAQNVLKSLSQDTSSYPFVPRSVILDKMSVNAAGGDVDEPAGPKVPDLKGKSLKDIDALQLQTMELQYRNPNSQPIRQFSDKLATMNRAVEQANSGMVGQVFSFCVNSYGGNNGDTEFAPMREELLLQILPDYLDTGKSYPLQPHETPKSYFLRVIQESREKGDWPTTWKALEGYRTYAFSSGQTPGWLSADIQGISQFIIAQNYERAEQYVDAVRSYKRVLGQAGQNLPVEEATKRLNALKKDHPEDFEAASKPLEMPQRGMPYPPNASPRQP